MTSHPTKPLSATLASACAMLDQCQEFVDSVDQARYAAPSSRMMGSTIGQHLRHTLDHFAAALVALEDQVIDYDHRDRDTPIENDREAALDALAQVRTRLERVPEGTLASGVQIRVMLSAEGDEAQLASTLARELAFATHHGIHHCAMMVAIASEHALPVPEGFGKAPSTRNYESAGASSAS